MFWQFIREDIKVLIWFSIDILQVELSQEELEDLIKETKKKIKYALPFYAFNKYLKYNFVYLVQCIELKRTGTLPPGQMPMIYWSRVSGGISCVTRVHVGKLDASDRWRDLGFASVPLN